MNHDTGTLAEQFGKVIGQSRVVTDADDTRPYQHGWRDRYQRAALAVLMPGSTQEVSALAKTCAALKVAECRKAVIPA